MSEETSQAAFSMPIRARWRDFDALQHVNSANYVSFLEEARDAYLESHLGFTSGEQYVLASMALEYLRPLTLNDRDAIVEITPIRAGRTSITLRERLVALSGEISLTSETVIVLWDATTSEPRSRPITSHERRLLFPDTLSSASVEDGSKSVVES